MKTFNIYKKRDGQSFEKIGSYNCVDFDSAKKEFAKNVFEDLLNSKHGDNFIYHSKHSALEGGVNYFTEEGIYYNSELFLSDASVSEGFESFNEDVYTWEIRNSISIEVYDNADSELFTTDDVEDMEQAERIYPTDEYTIKVIE